MSEYQNKLDEAFGEPGNLDEVLKQGANTSESPLSAQSQNPVNPEQPEKVVETQNTGEETPVATETTGTEQQTEEEAENQTLTEEEHEDKPEKHRDTKAEARIAKLIRERERLKGQLDAIRQTRQVEVSPTEAVPALVDPDAPNPANYPEGDKDIDYKVDAKLYQRDMAQKQAAFRTQQQEMLKKFPDMKDLLEMDAERVNSGIRTANPTVVRLIQESDVSGDLWHYLLANSDEAIRIAEMDPLRTAKEIGKIEMKLATPELVPEVKPRKQLPAPINPVKTTKTNSVAGTKNYGFTDY